MTISLQTDPVPLQQDADGALRVGSSRVLLEMVIRAFEQGDTPEAIVESYSTLQLNEVYAVISYYLNHRDEVQHYLRKREQSAAEIRAIIEAGQPDAGEFRRRIQARSGDQSRS